MSKSATTPFGSASYGQLLSYPYESAARALHLPGGQECEFPLMVRRRSRSGKEPRPVTIANYKEFHGITSFHFSELIYGWVHFPRGWEGKRIAYTGIDSENVHLRIAFSDGLRL